MFNSKQIKKAWKIRREAAVKFGCRVMEISWKECLKMVNEDQLISYDSFKKNYKKVLELGIETEHRVMSEYEKYVKSHTKEIEKKNAVKEERNDFLKKALSKLGKDLFIECFEYSASNKKKALAAINSINNGEDVVYSNLVKDELEYQMRVQ